MYFFSFEKMQQNTLFQMKKRILPHFNEGMKK
jgi:hypothetical protein